jgi:hypothetical protein
LTLGDLLDFEGNLRANATGELLALEHIDLWDGESKGSLSNYPGCQTIGFCKLGS